MSIVKAAMIGDVVGHIGLETLENKLPALIKDQNIDFVAVNGENAAQGFGMTESDYKRIIAAGADVITSGNHIWEKREFLPVLDTESNMLRPANYPDAVKTMKNQADTPNSCGTGYFSTVKNGITWIVINLLGRESMCAINCPFQCLDNLINKFDGYSADIHPLFSIEGFSIPLPLILVDFHAESSREKEALGYFADGRAAVVAGTHTHVQTADERILPGGTAYITDLGMTGNTDSVIGMDPKICIERVRRQVQYQMELAQLNYYEADINSGQMQGVIAEIDTDTAKAVSIQRI